jgi:hypothetical protein
MTEKQFPLDFNAHLHQEPDQSLTIVVEITGIPSVEMGVRVVSDRGSQPVRTNCADPAAFQLHPSNEGEGRGTALCFPHSST